MWVTIKVIIILLAFFLLAVILTLVEDAKGSELGVFSKCFIMALFFYGAKYLWSLNPKSNNKNTYNNFKADD